jgi:broad specificity phosphatase PhoE
MKKPLSIFAFVLASIQAVPAVAAEFLFIRHAESTTNAGGSGTPAELIDPPLTALGQQQAVDLASYLDSFNVTSIYTSAYQRTALTIAPTAAEFGLTPTADARTNEWYAGDTASAGGVIDYPAIYALFGQWAAGNTSAKLDVPNSESLDDMVARVLPAWQEILTSHKDDEGVVVIVGHGAAMGYVMPYLVNNVSLSFAAGHGLANTGIIDVRLDANDNPYVTNWQGTPVAPVPLPAGLPLLLSGLAVLAGAKVARHRRQ